MKEGIIDLIKSLELTDEQRQQLLERVEGMDERQLDKLRENLVSLKKLQTFLAGRGKLPSREKFLSQLRQETKQVVGEILEEKLAEQEEKKVEEIREKIKDLN